MCPPVDPAIDPEQSRRPRNRYDRLSARSVGVVCPPGVPITSTLCAEHVLYKIRFHWVCPAIENVNSNICRETDFEVPVSINGKVVFSADGMQIK